MNKPKLYMMSGISGSGKTTFARQFAEDHGLRYLNPDQFYGIYNGDECNHYDEFEIWMALFRALHMAEQACVDTILDTNSPTIVDRTQILNWFPGFEPRLIYITAPIELCKQNNRSRRRRIPEDVMDSIIERFEPPSVRDDHRWKSIITFSNRANNGFSVEEIILH